MQLRQKPSTVAITNSMLVSIKVKEEPIDYTDHHSTVPSNISTNNQLLKMPNSNSTFKPQEQQQHQPPISSSSAIKRALELGGNSACTAQQYRVATIKSTNAVAIMASGNKVFHYNTTPSVGHKNSFNSSTLSSVSTLSSSSASVRGGLGMQPTTFTTPSKLTRTVIKSRSLFILKILS